VEYWLRAASKRLEIWRRLSKSSDAKDFAERGLVRFPDAPDIGLMLRTASADEDALRSIFGELFVYFSANADYFNEFACAETVDAKREALCRTESNPNTTEPLRRMMQNNIDRLAE
jgi:hypothetical protein